MAATLSRMAETTGRLGVERTRAVATSAVRDASNQEEFLAQMSAALGVPVEVISGQEEARLIHLGVTARWPQPGRNVLIVDVGGGSAELILSVDNHLVEGVSKPLGAVRLTEVFLTKDPPSGQQLHRMESFIEDKLSQAVKEFGRALPDVAIGTSASAAAVVCAANGIPRERREEADRIPVTTAQLRKLYKELSRLPLSERKKFVGIGPRRAEIIVPGAAVLMLSLERFKLNGLQYSTAGVRDGIIADLIARSKGGQAATLTEEQRHVVEALARRYTVPLEHCRKVAEMSRVLFHCLTPLHRMPPAYGRMLEAAAYLHDIGHYVADVGHHKHSFYLVSNSDLPGFTLPERRVIAMLCRFHRKSMPQARHDAFQALEASLRQGIIKLLPLLRLADGLDQSHTQGVRGISVHHIQERVEVVLRAEIEPELELWAAERVSPVFQQVYERPLQVTWNQP